MAVHNYLVLAMFLSFTMVFAILPIMEKLSVILRSEHFRILALTWKRVKDDEDSTIKNIFDSAITQLILKIYAFSLPIITILKIV